METNPTRMCELLVGLPDVDVNGVGDWPHWLRISISTRNPRPSCPGCAGRVWRHGLDEVELADLPCFGRRTRLVWLKQRWRCPNATCRIVTFVESDARIAADRAAITDRAGGWATFQVGRHGRSVSEVAVDLGCDWHTVMDAVVHYGTALIEDPTRIGSVTAIGLDEVLFCRSGPFKRRAWSTQVVEVAAVSCWMLCLVATLPAPVHGSPSDPSSGVLRSVGRRWICPGRIGPCSTQCSRTPSRSRTRSTS